MKQGSGTGQGKTGCEIRVSCQDSQGRNVGDWEELGSEMFCDNAHIGQTGGAGVFVACGLLSQLC